MKHVVLQRITSLKTKRLCVGSRCILSLSCKKNESISSAFPYNSVCTIRLSGEPVLDYLLAYLLPPLLNVVVEHFSKAHRCQFLANIPLPPFQPFLLLDLPGCDGLLILHIFWSFLNFVTVHSSLFCFFLSWTVFRGNFLVQYLPREALRWLSYTFAQHGFFLDFSDNCYHTIRWGHSDPRLWAWHCEIVSPR